MSVDGFSFADADVQAGRTPTVAYTNPPSLFQTLRRKFSLADARFLGSHTGFDDGGLQWEGVRPLGKGGFGMVGLWAGKDNTGAIVKEIAVKQCQQKKGARVPEEAMVMKQLNQFRCSNILRLENFKYYPQQRMWRFYLEFCPYGDLQDLWTRSRPRASRHYLPEQFLWHLFNGLAQAANVMAHSDFLTLDENKPTDQKMLHLDIKPANCAMVTFHRDLDKKLINGVVMLGYKSDNSLFQGYPVIKLADWGVAGLTGPDDDENPGRFFMRGTQRYMPPEHRPHFIRVKSTPPQPFRYKFTDWTNPPNPADTKLESRSMVWPIGLVIYLLMTLTTIGEWTAKVEHMQEEEFERLGRHFTERIQTGSTPEYSQELRDLVYESLNPSVALRPTAQALVTRTDAVMQRYRTTTKTGRNNTKSPGIRQLQRSKSVLNTQRPPGLAQPQDAVAPAGGDAAGAADGPVATPPGGQATVSAAMPSPWAPAGLTAAEPHLLSSDRVPTRSPLAPKQGSKRQRLGNEEPALELHEGDVVATRPSPKITTKRERKRRGVVESDDQPVLIEDDSTLRIAGRTVEKGSPPAVLLSETAKRWCVESNDQPVLIHGDRTARVAERAVKEDSVPAILLSETAEPGEGNRRLIGDEEKSVYEKGRNPTSAAREIMVVSDDPPVRGEEMNIKDVARERIVISDDSSAIEEEKESLVHEHEGANAD